MPGNFSFVTFHDGRHKTVSREQGIKMQQILDGLIEPDNEAQANYVLNIRRIDPLHGAAARKVELSVMETPDNLTNIGVLQGQSEQIPRGDR